MRRWISRFLWMFAGAALALSLFLGARMIVAQPPTPHPAFQDDNCLSCHQSGVAGAPILARDHLGRDNDDCLFCHRVSGVPADDIPHTLDGREDCRSCHLEGIGGTPVLPGAHIEYENDSCNQCHLLSPDAQLPEHPSTSDVAAETELCADEVGVGGTCVSCHQLIFSADGTHVLFTGQPIGDPDTGAEFYSRLCATCHGEDGTTPVGEDEIVINSPEYWAVNDDATILEDIGLGSHGNMAAFAEEFQGPFSWEDVLHVATYIRTWGPLDPSLAGLSSPEGASVQPPIPPHPLEGMDECLTCHAEGGFKPIPSSHGSFEVDDCTLCHTPEGVSGDAPTIPHDLEGRDDCLVCHDTAGGIRPAPADHEGRASDQCQLCHEVAAGE